MKYIKVIDKIYTDPNVAKCSDGINWKPATPLPYPCNLWEWFVHKLGFHFSFGQPFCVVCMKEQEDYIDGHEIDGM